MENQQPTGEAQNSQQKMWYKQPKKLWLCIIGAIILFALLVRNSEDLFITLMLISLVCFLISWLFPNIFYKLFRKESKSLVRTTFGLATIIFFVAFGVISDKNKPDSLKKVDQQLSQQEENPVVAETKNENKDQKPQPANTEAQNNNTSTTTDKPETQPTENVAMNTENATNKPTDAEKEKAQKELDDVMSLSKRAYLVTTYEFSDTATVVYADKVWYTQTVQFKKDFLAKIATLKKIITGYQHFEVRDAYSNEKVAEVTAFSGSLEVYK